MVGYVSQLSYYPGTNALNCPRNPCRYITVTLNRRFLVVPGPVITPTSAPSVQPPLLNQGGELTTA